MSTTPLGVSHEEDRAPDAFKEQEERLQRALQGAESRLSAEEEAEEEEEEDRVPEDDDLQSILDGEEPPPPAPRPRRESKPPLPTKKVTLETNNLKFTFPVTDVQIDSENSSISLFLVGDIDLIPRIENIYRLTAKGKVYEVVFAGARTRIKIDGREGLLVAFVARSLADDGEERES